MVPMHKLASNFHCGIKKQNQTVQLKQPTKQQQQPTKHNQKKRLNISKGSFHNLSVKLWDVNTWHWSQAGMHKALANSRE